MIDKIRQMTTIVSLQDFIARNHQKKGRTSKLMPFKDDILFLKQSGYSQQQILDFLSQNGLTVGMTTLNSFIRKHGISNQTEAIKSQQPESALLTPHGNKSTPRNQPPKKGIKKFDWKNAKTDG